MLNLKLGQKNNYQLCKNYSKTSNCFGITLSFQDCSQLLNNKSQDKISTCL